MAQLFSTNHPIYSISPLTGDLFYIAGGGGKAKTGIPNTIELLKLEYNDKYYTVQSLCKHDLGTQLIMQSEAYCDDRHPPIVAASVGNLCHIYELNGIIENNGGKDTDEKDEEEDQPQADKEESDNSKEYSVKKIAEVVTDEAVKDSCQNVVRFFRNGTRAITAGEDGKIRIWTIPLLKRKEELNGHLAEVTNIIVHPTKEMAVSISRDCTCKVWSLDSYTLTSTLEWTKYKEYRFRAICFSDDGEYMYSINIPLKPSSKNRKKSFVVKWRTSDWKEVRSSSMGLNILTTITVRDNYVAIGNVSGDITVLSTDLKHIMTSKSIHTSFITGLCFMPSSDDKSPPLLLSTSVDKRCCLTFISQEGSNLSLILFFIALTALLALALSIILGIDL